MQHFLLLVNQKCQVSVDHTFTTIPHSLPTYTFRNDVRRMHSLFYRITSALYQRKSGNSMVAAMLYRHKKRESACKHMHSGVMPCYPPALTYIMATVQFLYEHSYSSEYIFMQN